MTKQAGNNRQGTANIADDRVLGTVIHQSKEELLECIQNLMGVFDTPISRRAINNDFAEEVRKIGRQILETNGKSMYGL